jgi:hypothetical protein
MNLFAAFVAADLMPTEHNAGEAIPRNRNPFARDLLVFEPQRLIPAQEA